MAEEEAKTSTTATADETAEAPKESTKPQEDAKKADVPAPSTSAADEDESQGEGEDAGKPDQESEAKGSEAEKQRNRQEFRIRQLTDSNPNVQAIKDKLQPWVEAADDQRDQRDRQRDVNDYVRDVAQTQDNLQRDAETVFREIPSFNPGSPEFNEGLYKRAMAQFARDMAITDQNGVTDANGNPIIVGTRMRLLDYMREKAEDYGIGSIDSGKSGKASDTKKSDSKSKAKMDAAADTPGGASAEGRKPKSDETEMDKAFLAGFEDPYGRHTPQNKHAWDT